MHTISITPTITALTSPAEIPMLGNLAVNAYYVAGDEPMLVDSGMTPDADDFLATLSKLVDPADLKWIWLTHADRDHTGALTQLMNLAPNARIVTAFITLGLMSVGNQPIPPERAYLVRHGTRVPVGGRDLVALRPPLFDNPGTVGFFDPSSRVLFSSDFLGAVLPTAELALSDDVAAVSKDDVTAGQLIWGSVDAPWAHSVDESRLAAALEEFRGFGAETVVSTHLPPIRGGLEQHLATIARLPRSEPTALPDQAILEAAMGEIAHGE